MQNVSEGPLVASCILVELAVVSTHLQGSFVDHAFLLGSCYVVPQGPTAAKVGDVGLSHALALGLDEHVECRQIALPLDLLLRLVLLDLDAALNSLDIALKPPLLLEFSQLFLADCLLSM